MNLNNSTKDLNIRLYDNSFQEPLRYELSKQPHIIICSQEDNHIDEIVKTILNDTKTTYDSKQVKFIILSPRPSFYNSLDYYKYRNKECISETKDIIKTLTSLNKTMERRYDLQRKERALGILNYNQKMIKTEDKRRIMPYLILILEDLIVEDENDKREIDNLMLILVQKSRAVGIHIVILSSKPSRLISFRYIKFITNRVSFKFDSAEDSIVLFGDANASNLNKNEWYYRKVL